MEGKIKCLFCDFEADAVRVHKSRKMTVNCPNCLSYRISERDYNAFGTKFKPEVYTEKKHVISGYIRELNESGMETPLIKANEEGIKEFAENPKAPKTLMEKLDKFLLYLYDRTDSIGQVHEFPIKKIYPAMTYARNEEELLNIIDTLDQLELLENKKVYGDLERCTSLTVKGLEHAENLKKEHPHTSQVFAAMWFDKCMDASYKAMKKACESCGYKVRRIDEKQFNSDIVDEIIAEIKASRFLIADLTGQRGGVYYEAGYAEGMGLPVIYIWDKTKVEKIHFDIEHKNTIFYESPEELEKKLVFRIKATIGDYR